MPQVHEAWTRVEATRERWAGLDPRPSKSYIQGMSEPKPVAILGASDKPDRYSNMLIKRLRGKGHPVYPINPALKAIDGVPAYRSLAELPPGVEVLSVYMNAERSSAIADAILACGIPRVIFNPGAENPALAERLAAAGVHVEEACSLVLSGVGQL